MIFGVENHSLRMKREENLRILSQLEYIIISKSNQLTGTSNFINLTHSYYDHANSNLQNYGLKLFLCFILESLPTLES